jgi:hypothetical protein
VLWQASPWPLRDVLARLADAADHLLHDHDCSAHGHEGVLEAVTQARRILHSLPHTPDRIESIVRYFRHIEIMEIGSVASKATREIVGWCASWIENRLDEKWREEVDAQREAEREGDGGARLMADVVNIPGHLTGCCKVPLRFNLRRGACGGYGCSACDNFVAVEVVWGQRLDARPDEVSRLMAKMAGRR